MASYAPVYRLPTSQHSFLARQQKRQRKRKRGQDADQSPDDGQSADESGADKLEDEPELEALQDEPRVLHPVNKTDPYYIAGWAREKPLPGGNFPHAAVRDVEVQKAHVVEEELAKLRPPIYVPKRGPSSPAGSLKVRHLDNLTAIWHSCMLKQDWTRASRVWGLILRTEIGGFGPDVRHHGRWMIGAEILMRRHQMTERPSVNGGSDWNAPVMSDDGFQLAREYYERMCLQYPQLARSHHSAVTAYAIYPAFFNIWVYQVQERSKRARQKLAASLDPTDFDVTQSFHHDSTEHRSALRQIRTEELSAVAPITRRLDELLLSPPFDTSSELLQLRGMISLWLANLHTVLGDLDGPSEGDDEYDVATASESSKTRHRTQADVERAKTKEMFLRVVNKGMQLSAENLTFLEGENSRLDDADEE